MVRPRTSQRMADVRRLARLLKYSDERISCALRGTGHYWSDVAIADADGARRCPTNRRLCTAASPACHHHGSLHDWGHRSCTRTG